MEHYCKECKHGITPEEYEYSLNKFGRPLCRDHQKDSFQKEGNGLSKRDSRYTEGMIKGRIAETLIEELFLSLDYNVFRYGVENAVPGIVKLLKGVRSDVAEDIRRMPDFVVQRGKDVFFIEVKFRKDEKFDINDKSIANYPYKNAFFIIVSKAHIKCISYGELKEGKKITPASRNYLGNRKEFELDKNVIIDFCNFAVKFFSEVQ